MFRRFSGGRRSVPIGCSCLFGAGRAHLNLGPSGALHLRLIRLHHWGCRCVQWGQRPEFGSSYLAVKARAPLMVPRPRRSVTVLSQGQNPRRAVHSQLCGRWEGGASACKKWGEWLLIWTSPRMGLCNSWLFFFGKTKTANLTTPTASLLFVGGPGSSVQRLASFLHLEAEVWGCGRPLGFFVLQPGLLAADSKY